MYLFVMIWFLLNTKMGFLQFINNFFSGGMVKLTSSLMTVVPKIHRKVIKVAGKRPTTVHRPLTGKFNVHRL